MDRLQSMLTTDNPHLPCVVAVTGGVALISGVVLYKLLSRKKPLLKEGPPNTAVIYQFKRGPKAPSMSPFPVKLETFCRLAKIPYVTVSSSQKSSKGKMPWMTYNGEAVHDSQFCVEFFKSKYGIDVNQHLDLQQRGISKLIQVLADEHLYWTMVYFRWVHPNDFFPNLLTTHFKFPRLLMPLIRRTARVQLLGQGIGRHSAEEIRQILMEDLRALSGILGSKPFMLGETMCEGDCAAFGMLCQFVWHQEDEALRDVLEDNFPNLYNYCLRVKDKLWPDWDECCQNTTEFN